MKGYLSAYLEVSKTEKLLCTELSKLSKPSSGSFDSSSLEAFLENKPYMSGLNVTVPDALEAEQSLTGTTIETAESVPTICPLCCVRLDKDDSPALIVRSCQFCNYTQATFNNWQRATALAEEMFEASTFEECQAITDALDERAATFMLESVWDYERAMRAAEADILPPLLDAYSRKTRFAGKTYGH